MNLYAFLSFLSSVVSFTFGGFVLMKSFKNIPNKIFFYLCISSSLLCFAEFELRMAETYERALFWTKVYAVWPVVLALLFHFTFALNKKLKIKSISTVLIYLPAFCIMFVELFTNRITIGPVKVYWGWTFRYSENIFSKIVFVWCIIILFLSVYHSFRYYLKSEGQIKKQAYYIFIGYMLNALTTFVFEIIFQVFEINTPEFGNSFGFILFMILGYAIWKYQLFEIRPESLAGKIVATISDALFFVDSKHGIIEVNKTALQLLHYERYELLGQPIDFVLDNSDRELTGTQICDKINEKGTINDLEVNLKTKENRLVPVSLSLAQVQYKNNEEKGLILLGRDITERKRMIETLKQSEQQLRVLNANKDKFFSIMAHDLKNPFHAILNASEMLDKAFAELEKDEKKELISYIHQSSKSIYRLLENLLAWSRSQQGNIVFRPGPLNLRKVVDENIVPLQDMAALKSIHLYTTIEEDLYVVADLDMLSIILRNLISNAIKFTPRGGEVKVISYPQIENDALISVSVNDTGVGIENQILKDLFRIDKSVSTSGTNLERGTGLGLILCKEFTEMLGSRITVESEPGKGSKFSFTLSRFSVN